MSNNVVDELIKSYKNGYKIDALEITNEDVKNVFENNTKGTVSVSATSPWGSIVYAFSEMYSRVLQLFSSAILNNYVTTAYGVNLDVLGSDVKNIPRKQGRGTYTIAILDNTSSTNVTFDKGTLLISNQSLEFKTQYVLTVNAGSSGQVECYSVDTGSIPCDKNSLTLSTSVTGVTVTNTQGILGYLTESDTDYRARLRLDTSLYNSMNLSDSLYLQLVAINDVISLRIFSNPNDTPDNNGIPAHRTEVVIAGGNELEIGRVLYNNSSTLSYSTYVGDVNVEVPSEVTGQIFNMKFSRPTIVNVTIDITIIPDNEFYNDSTIGVVKSSIIAYINTVLGIGDDVYVQGIIGATRVDYTTDTKDKILGVSTVNVMINGLSDDLIIGYKEISSTDSTLVNVRI